MNTDGPNQIYCPTCRSLNSASDPVCWLCHDPLTAGTPQQVSASNNSPTSDSPGESGLSYVCMVIALSIVCLGLFLIFPGIGIIFACLISPALVKARRKAGQDASGPLTAGQLFITVMSSIGAAITIGVAAVIAGGVVCIGFVFGGAMLGDMQGKHDGGLEGMAIGIYAGLLLGVIVALVVTSKLVQRRRKRDST